MYLSKIILAMVFSSAIIISQPVYACAEHEKKITIAEIEANLKTHKLTLPSPTSLKASFVPYVISSNLVYISGQIPLGFGDIKQYQGQLGKDISLEKGQAIAKLAALNVLTQLKAACKGDLSCVKRAVKLTVYVNSNANFTDQPKIANAASDTIINVFGSAIGSHARSAIGVSQLPLGVAVEIEAIFEINEKSAN